MRLTKRDREILQFINAVGWCIAPQIEKRFSIKWWIVYRIMKRLISGGMVVHQRLSFEFHGIYFLTPLGASFTDLPPIERVSKGNYDHQKVLVNLVLKLREMYPDAAWVSERHLKHQKFLYGVGRFGHVADGVLIFPDGMKVAIELEISVKGKFRLEKILKAYGGQTEISEAWYFCTGEVMKAVTALSKKRSFVKIFSIKDLLHE